ncbi:hypothetical protein BJ165DRAFT_1533189 [Panaeolus papilionaceus]|nr:hypothetical protein BJ165DRAFT_1533189 [Panaeolus papilionaceus]
MASLEDLELQKLEIIGKLSIQEHHHATDTSRSQEVFDFSAGFVVLIMGPTGAGKSSFIEALVGQDDCALEKISSSQLEGYTQRVTAYRIDGLLTRDSSQRKIYLIDTPGFSDNKFSEFDIISKIRAWWNENGERYFDQIIYLTPVGSVRLPGSQRETLAFFKKLMGKDGAGMLTIATTMWDTVWGEQGAQRAERNFEQLRDEVWKNFIADGSRITRFYNTQESALQILDKVLRMPNKFSDLEYFSRPMDRLPYTTDLRDDLLSRIHSLRMQKDVLEKELGDLSITTREGLKPTLEAELEEIISLIARFQTQVPILGAVDIDNLEPSPDSPLLRADSSPSTTPPPDVDHNEPLTLMGAAGLLKSLLNSNGQEDRLALSAP